MIFRRSTGDAQARALVAPSVDFWLVGGAGVLVYLAFQYAVQNWPTLDWTGQAAIWAAYFAFAINFPHFAYSYLLFYPGYFRRLTGTETTLASKIRLVVAGLAVPLFLIGYFIHAWKAQDAQLLAWAVMAMIFTVGWHYVKQGYGVFITLSVYKGVFYKEWQKRILYVNAYVVWIYTWCRTNSVTGVQPYYDITYHVTAYPGWLVNGSYYLALATSTLAACVIVQRWFDDQKRVFLDKSGFAFSTKGVSVNAVMGYVAAIYLWVMFPYGNPAFYVFIPLFHSLQYFPFVYKFKTSEFNRTKSAPEGNPQATYRRAVTWLLAFTAAGIALGALFFDTIPNYMDSHPWVNGDMTKFIELDPQFYLISFIVFINIHHFFIDSAFWRRDNTDVQRNLFRA